LEKVCVSFMLLHMQQTLTLLPSDSSEAESNPVFNVLIAYEDFETGKHAKQTYDFLVENLGHECHMTNQMWKFDVLSIPKLREIAVRDATMADIIILSSHGQELPDCVVKWIESWLMRGTTSLALVALFEKSEASGQVSPALRDYLVDVAKRGHMEFFAQPAADLSNRSDESLQLPLRDISSDRTLSTIAGVVHRDISIPRWGLNE
jgi:hypothetical protein